MSELTIFNNPEFGEIRTTMYNGEIAFIAKDVAERLGYTWNGMQRIEHVPVEWRGVTSVVTPSGIQDMAILTEQGLYFFLGRSDKPAALPFQKWIAGDVIPSIRKHGAYITPATIENMIASPEFGIKLLTALQEEQSKNAALSAENTALATINAAMKPKSDYFDALVDRNLLTNFRDTAKQLHMKEKVFISFLLSKKFVYRDQKGKLMPYAEKNNGFFEIKECFNDKTDWSGVQTLITPKGREAFRLLCVQ